MTKTMAKTPLPTWTLIENRQSGVARRTRRARIPNLLISLSLGLGVLFTGLPSHAESTRQSLRDRTSFFAAERLLQIPSRREHWRAIDKLARAGEPRTIERLIELLDGDKPALRNTEARLRLVRALSPYADRKSVTVALDKVLSQAKARDSLSLLLLQSSAMALAASGKAHSLEALTAYLHRSGPSAEAAKLALVAYPSPLPSIDELQALPPLLSDLLGEIGDTRALPALRTTLRRDGSFAKDGAALSAAIALARLGDEDAIEAAKAFHQAEEVSLRLAAAEIFAISGMEAEAGETISKLVALHQGRERALKLALHYPLPSLTPTLTGIARGGDRDAGPKAIEALGMINSSEAITALGSMLDDADRARHAAKALVFAKGDGARRALERALLSEKARPPAALAGALRKFWRPEEAPANLNQALDALLASKAAAERKIGAFGLALSSRSKADTLLASKDESIIRGAALALEPHALAKALSTETLLAWSDEGSPWAAVAIVALGYRDGPGLRFRLERFLTSEQPEHRIHAARALAVSSEADASARLARAYDAEADAEVRLAIVGALAQRREPQRLRTLELTASLDPDIETRNRARRALNPEAPDQLSAREASARSLLALAFSLAGEKAPRP